MVVHFSPVDAAAEPALLEFFRTVHFAEVLAAVPEIEQYFFTKDLTSIDGVPRFTTIYSAPTLDAAALAARMDEASLTPSPVLAVEPPLTPARHISDAI